MRALLKSRGAVLRGRLSPIGEMPLFLVGKADICVVRRGTWVAEAAATGAVAFAASRDSGAAYIAEGIEGSIHWGSKTRVGRFDMRS